MDSSRVPPHPVNALEIGAADFVNVVSVYQHRLVSRGLEVPRPATDADPFGQIVHGQVG